MILIDTNIFLEFLLGQKQKAECKRLLDMASAGEIEATVTHFSVHAIEAILGKSRALAPFLSNLERSVGLTVYDTTIADEVAAGMLARRIHRDFDDALQYYVAKKLGATQMVSFDDDLDGLDLERVEPGALSNGR